MAQLLLFILLLGSTHSWGNSGQTYLLADLEILAQEENYEEFFKHALDIRPSERQDGWKSMASKMAELYAQNILKKSVIPPEDFQQVEKLYHWPNLKADEFFKQRRAEIGLRYLGKCLKETNPCWDSLRAFWEADQDQTELSYKLAELVAPLSPPIPAWTFLDVALKSSLSEFYCQKPFVMESLWGKLGIDYIRLGPQGDLMAKIDQTIHPDCIPALLQEAKSRLYTPKADNDRELSFQILKSQKKVSKDLMDFFYTLYLLERPSQGELFNYAWNNLKEMGSSADRRDQVMNEMRKLDPLPDELLGSLDQSKKRAILNQFKNYFPEYLNFYSNKCVDYYGGKGKFPKGNPTMHCQDLMSSDLGRQILDADKINKYQEVRKI